MEDRRRKISQYDLVYKSPSRCWADGIALGNGKLCALAYESEGVLPELLVNLNTLWDERHPVFKRHSMEHLRRIAAGEFPFVPEMLKENPPGGCSPVPVPAYGVQLRFEPGSALSLVPGHNVTKRLHLYDGVLTTSLDKHLSHPVMESFICPDANVLVVRMRNVSCLTACMHRIRLYRAAQPEYADPEFILEGDAAGLKQKIETMEYSAAVLVKSRPDQPVAFSDVFGRFINSEKTPPAQGLVKTSLAGKSAEFVTNGNYDVFLSVDEKASPAELIAGLRRFAETGSESLMERQKRYWNAFWEKNDVSLGDAGLDQLWYLSNYHMGIAEGATPAWGLCGPWFGRTDGATQKLPWFGYFTNDYNAQLPVMPLENINRPELAEGTYRMIHSQLPEAGKYAATFGMPGALYPLGAGPDGVECASGPFRLCQGAGPYWAVLIYRHYLCTKNKKFLEECGYDVIREVCRFFAAYLEWNETEQMYHLTCSQNPELAYLHLPDPIDTLALLKGAFKAAVASSILLNRDEEDRKKWEHILAHYPPYPVSSKGFSPLPGLPEGHINHSRTLAPVFPTGEMDPEFPGPQFEDAKKELHNPAWNGFMHSWACNDGWTEGWTGKVYHKAIPACRMGDSGQAWKYLCDLISTNVKPNGLISHNTATLSNSSLSEKNIFNIPDQIVPHDCGPIPVTVAEIACGRCGEDATEDPECKEKMYPVLEGPAVFLLLVSEMLVQGYNGLVRLFPALPPERDASFRDLRTEGPLLVSSVRRNGKILYVRIKVLHDQSFSLLNPWPAETTVYLNGKPVVLERHHPFAAKAGEEFFLSPDPSEERESAEATAEAAPHLILFKGCRGAFLGKPSPAEYYAGLEKIRNRLLSEE